ncbi:YceI-like domain-containing protein [Flavobacterium sp. 103]|uniref:YceI family protein n=1 Tax=Flavobacterium sp. 103 TaxID=2135624 RepID=UPI000D5F1C35|nr:YceI family protein [Flavobacterium sp. 103]PVX46434.1 YceI-like domain-containing protein [Flavobacterium sp. 103]
MIKKAALLMICFFVGNIIFSQKMMTRTGEIKFEASVPSFESVAAESNSVSAVLDESNGEFAVLALIKTFKFKVPLMEEHFNENYIESSIYPKATFKGKIINFDVSKLTTSGKYDLEGDLTIHGVTKKIKTKISMVLKEGKLYTTSGFAVKAQDFNIKIPGIVKSKISEDVIVTVNLVLGKK